MTLYKQLMENKKTRQCPHCNGTIVLLTYTELNYGTFDCPHCGAYKQWPDFDNRPGYFVKQTDGVDKSYMTHEEHEKWIEARRSAEVYYPIVFTDDTE